MAKGKYKYWLTEEGRMRLESYARDGLLDVDIAKKMNIATSTLNEWKKKYPEISESLKRAKEIPDINVENALYKKATGYKTTVRKAVKVKDIQYDNNGKKKSEKERIVYVDEEVYYPPDTLAEIFWLKNRSPDKWRDKVTHEEKGDNDVNLVMDGDCEKFSG